MLSGVADIAEAWRSLYRLQEARGRAGAAKNKELGTSLNSEQKDNKAAPRFQGLRTSNINLESGEDKDTSRSAGVAASKKAIRPQAPGLR